MPTPLEATSLRFLHETDPPRGLTDASFTLKQGTLTALLGPNGAGKSTLLSILATARAPQSGSFTVNGQDPAADLRKARASLGVCFQSTALDPLLTTEENLKLAAALYAIPKSDQPAAIDRAIHSFELTEHRRRRVAKLSGGLQRRVDLARASLHQPRVLLLDEATAGLDPESRAALRANLRAALDTDTLGATLLATHLLDEAEHADAVLIMAEGRLAAQGTPDQLRASLGARLIAWNPRDLDISEAQAHAPDSNTLGLPREIALTSADTASLDPLATHLAAAGIPFRSGPPSLEDAYLAATNEGKAIT